MTKKTTTKKTTTKKASSARIHDTLSQMISSACRARGGSCGRAGASALTFIMHMLSSWGMEHAHHKACRQEQ